MNEMVDIQSSLKHQLGTCTRKFISGDFTLLHSVQKQQSSYIMFYLYDIYFHFACYMGQPRVVLDADEHKRTGKSGGHTCFALIL